MQDVTLSSEEFQLLSKKLDEISKKITISTTSPEERWIDNADLMILLNVSRRTVQSYRDNNMLAYSMIGNKIFYKLSDVQDLLERHYNKRLV